MMPESDSGNVTDPKIIQFAADETQAKRPGFAELYFLFTMSNLHMCFGSTICSIRIEAELGNNQNVSLQYLINHLHTGC
jgi:hypothetical protein